MKKNAKQLQKPATGAAASDHLLSEFGKPRSTRSPLDYATLLLDQVTKNICLLRADGSKDCCTTHEVQKIAQDIFGPIKRLLDQRKATGESLEGEADKQRNTRQIDAEERAQITYAYCYEAHLAYKSGDATAAWTLIVDATRIAADIKALVVFRAGGAFMSSSRGKKAAEASHAKSGHANSETRGAVRTLWLEWREGKHPEWKTQRLFADGCQERFNDTNVDTILKKWIPEWQRDIKGGEQSDK